MRLDHLLSKEHWPARFWGCSPGWPVQGHAPTVIGAPVVERRRVLVVELEGGTLTSSAGDLVSPLVRPLSCACACGGWVGNAVGWGGRL